MRRIVIIFVLTAFLFPSPPACFARVSRFKNNKFAQKHNLSLCGEIDIGLKFLCHNDWKTIESDGSVIFVISSDPLVTLSINKANFRVGFIEEITSDIFKKMDVYADGFRTEEITYQNGLKSKMVKAFAKKDVDIRLLDYYFINRNILYTVSFAVYPKKYWDEYKHLIKIIAESIDFMRYSEIYELKQKNTETNGIMVLERY